MQFNAIQCDIVYHIVRAYPKLFLIVVGLLSVSDMGALQDIIGDTCPRESD